jgi:acetyl esterase/lipase
VNGQLVPYLNSGWVVVNVEYRFLQQAMMPAPVEDVRCALNWVYEHAAQYAIDTVKIVQSGTSAGGHLALIGGVLPPHSPLDGSCGRAHDLKTAAIIDFYGIADLNALLALPARKNQVKKFFPNLNEAEKIGALVSPVHYLTKQTPPVFIVHGNEDPTVPFSQALCLKSMLDSLGVHTILHTVQGGGHGKFSKEEMTIIYKEISDFLKKELGESLRLEQD